MILSFVLGFDSPMDHSITDTITGASLAVNGNTSATMVDGYG